MQPGAERVADAPDAHAALDSAYDAAVLEHDDRGKLFDGEVLGELGSTVDVDAAAREAPWLRRQKSASYYTPEVLTKCVVKYALKELLKDKTADQILEFTICEPALGSGAFLNEALNQLADAYLDLKRKETHRDIQHAEIEREKQKVKAWMADNRVFGGT